MTILVVISSLSEGGAERVVSLLTNEWAKQHHVLLALFDSSRRDYPNGGRILDLRVPPSTTFAKKILNVGLRVKRLLDIVRSERPDRIYAFMESANFATIVAAALSNHLDRLWVSVRINPACKSPLFRTLISILYRLPKRVVANSEGVKQALETMGIPGDRISVIYNPVNLRRRQANAPDSKPPLDHRFILAAGRLVNQKGFDRLLTAFQHIENSDLHLAILGKGPEREPLIQQACKLGIRDRVHFPGRVSDVDIWYRTAECFVLSSRYEGLPNVLIEAMDNRCPVVSFDCPYGPSELIKDGENGLLVPDGNMEALAAAISRVLADEGFRLALATKGMETVTRFNVEEIASHWLA